MHEATPETVTFFAPGSGTPPLGLKEWLAVAAAGGGAVLLGLGLGLGAGIAFLADLLLAAFG